MKIAVMTDSTAYLPKELIEKYHIYIIPLSVTFGEESYREGIDITTEQFYEKLRKSEELPTTSQPSIGAFVNIYETLVAENYDAVITVHLSKKISGTYEAAQSAAELVEGLDVYAFDSGLSTLPQGLFAVEAAQLAKKDKTPEEIIAHLDERKEKIRAYFMVDDLTNLQKGGRLSGAQALVGGLLKIKPILHFVDGEIVPFEKIRTRKKAIRRIFSMLEEDIARGIVDKVIFFHANDRQSALDLEKGFQEKHPDIQSIITYFGPVIGTHLGEGALGVAWYHK